MSSIQRFPDSQSRAHNLDDQYREHARNQHSGPDGQGTAYQEISDWPWRK